MPFDANRYILERMGSYDRLSSAHIYDLMNGACEHSRKVGNAIKKHLPHFTDEVAACTKELNQAKAAR